MFTYTGSEERVYVDVNGKSFVAEPGQSYSLAADPGDGRWVAQAAPVAPVTVAEPAPAPTTPAN